MVIRVRRAGPADAEAIAALARELNLHEGDPVDHFTVEAVHRDGFGDAPQFTVLLAEIDGAPAGYSLFYDSYETGYAARGVYMCDLYVRPEARRCGVGRALIAAVAREARTAGRTYVWWASRAWNARAQAFYRTLGAVEEPLHGHAVSSAAFDALADAAEELDQGLICHKDNC